MWLYQLYKRGILVILVMLQILLKFFLKTVICVFWMNIWYGITFTKTEKVMGKLKKDFFIYIWQNVWFFCPEETLTIFCKIKCQSFNFICQVLEKSLKFAYQSYRLKEYICFRIFLKMRFFGPILELVMFFKSSAILGGFHFKNK